MSDDEQSPSSDGPLRRELAEAPPFLSWTALYVLVAVLLALEIAAFAVITVAFR